MEPQKTFDFSQYLAEQANIVCSWFRNQMPLKVGQNGESQLVPSRALLAFNRRQGDDSKPVSVVYLVSDDQDGGISEEAKQKLQNIISLPRSAHVVGHFSEEKINGQNPVWGSPVFLGKVEALREAVRNNLAIPSADNLDGPSDEVKNALDLLWFQASDGIVSFPVSVAGSPILTCYLPWQNPGDSFTDHDIVDNNLRAPLASFMAANAVAWLSRIAKEVSFRDAGKPTEEQINELIHIAAELLFAKSATSNGVGLFSEAAPLTYFSDGATIQGDTKWKIVLPSYKIDTGVFSNQTGDAGLLADVLSNHLQHLIHFMSEAAENRRKLTQQVGQAAKASLFDAIKDEFEKGMTDLRGALLRFSMAESHMDISNHSFLRIYRDANLHLMWRQDSSCYYDPNGESFGFEASAKEAHTQELRTIHDPSNPGNGYTSPIDALTAYGVAIECGLARPRKLHVFDEFITRIDSAKAPLALKSLKQLFHRTHANALYDFSILAHLSLALDAHATQRPELKFNGERLEWHEDVSGQLRLSWWKIIETLNGEWLKEENDGTMRLLTFPGKHPRPPVLATQFLGALMQLIGAELISVSGDAQRVVCQNLDVSSNNAACDIAIHCAGAGFPNEAFDFSDSGALHGLRSCFMRLAHAVGQFNGPHRLRGVSLDQLETHLPDNPLGWFSIIETSEAPILSIRLKREPEE
jgi:hypothetical protein